MNWNEYLSFSSLPNALVPRCDNPNLTVQTLKIGPDLKPWPFSLSRGFGAQQFGAFMPAHHISIFAALLGFLEGRFEKDGSALHKAQYHNAWAREGTSGDQIKLRPKMIQCINVLTDTHMKPHWWLCLTDSKSHTCGPAAAEVAWPSISLALHTFFATINCFRTSAEPRAFAAFRHNLFIPWVSCHMCKQSIFCHRLTPLFPPRDCFCGVSH